MQLILIFTIIYGLLLSFQIGLDRLSNQKNDSCHHLQINLATLCGFHSIIEEQDSVHTYVSAVPIFAMDKRANREGGQGDCDISVFSVLFDVPSRGVDKIRYLGNVLCDSFRDTFGTLFRE